MTAWARFHKSYSILAQVCGQDLKDPLHEADASYVLSRVVWALAMHWSQQLQGFHPRATAAIEALRRLPLCNAARPCCCAGERTGLGDARCLLSFYGLQLAGTACFI